MILSQTFPSTPPGTTTTINFKNPVQYNALRGIFHRNTESGLFQVQLQLQTTVIHSADIKAIPLTGFIMMQKMEASQNLTLLLQNYGLVAIDNFIVSLQFGMM